MTFLAVSSSRTMAGAQKFVTDEGINIAPRHKSGRERLIELSRQWQASQQAKQEARQRAKEAFHEVVQRAKRKHRRTRPNEPGNNGSHPREIVAMVAAWHGMGERDVYSRSRRVPVVMAKHDAVAAVYLNCRIDGRQYTLSELGRVFGIDHTSALHALKKRGLR